MCADDWVCPHRLAKLCMSGLYLYICYAIFRLLESVTFNFPFCWWFVLLNNIGRQPPLHILVTQNLLFLSLSDFVRSTYYLYSVANSPPPLWVVRLVTASPVSNGGSFAGSDVRRTEVRRHQRLSMCQNLEGRRDVKLPCCWTCIIC